jgi:ubiquinone/menaquinone biosynthesis C-methylase UbiE
VKINTSLVEALDPQPGERILEIGSGTGEICRMLAPRLAPDGWLAALDSSQEFSTIARSLALPAGMGSRICHLVGKAENLPLRSKFFDAAWAVRLLLHVRDPKFVVGEMRRLVRPGGRIVLADWDFETVTVDHSDRELTRRILNWRTDHHGGNNWSGRQLYALAHSTGLSHIEVDALVTIALDEKPALTQSLYRAAEAALGAAQITTEEHEAWMSELQERLACGRFFASIAYFILKGRN